ncbi:hypothetical protein Pla175_51680 [Pirellulimonas nuda]|uniref:Uncharacterized protein n=1 Tax=Pirellulimonas nuda TaxID=2528009 RepID=A0A518DJT5_9BACT|nr:hypothetical protein Pla175_51680 [Pirellulimonas nuda]
MNRALLSLVAVGCISAPTICWGQAASTALQSIRGNSGALDPTSIDGVIRNDVGSIYRGNDLGDGVGGVLSTGLSTSVALNQQQSRAQSTSRPTSTFNPTRIGTSSKPFANSSVDNTVSPYLNLFLSDSLTSDPNFVPYQSLVRPQQNQMDFNRQIQAQGQALNRRVQEIAAKPAFNPQGSEQQLPTGHSTVFGNMSHYYPQPQRR